MLNNCNNADNAAPVSGANPVFSQIRRRFPPDSTVFALYTYQGKCHEDLSVKEGDEMKIVEELHDPNWLVALDNNGNKGLVPANYIALAVPEALDQYTWFHGSINRSETELRLTPRNQDGLFLVRHSANHPGDLTLCVVCSGQISHYHTHRIPLGIGRHCYTIDEETRFYPLDTLITHYKADADGLCCELGQSVPAPPSVLAAPSVPALPGALRMQEVLGRGEFGEVRKGFYNDKPVAVKCLSQTAKAAIAAFKDEAEVMKELQHPNLVKFIGTMMDEMNGQLLLITEYMSLGSLLNYLRSRGQSVIDKRQQLRFAIDTAEGMKYLAGEKLVHRDLAARNILLDHDGDGCIAKVADFGLAKSISSEQQPQPNGTQPERIPLKWTAPECVSDRTKFSEKSDVWSFGVLLWEIFSFGRMPYPRIKADQVQRNVEKGYRMEAPDKCPPKVYEMMRSCWQIDPKERPKFRDLSSTLKMMLSSD